MAGESGVAIEDETSRSALVREHVDQLRFGAETLGARPHFSRYAFSTIADIGGPFQYGSIHLSC